jgi:hypothetical protein
MPDHKPEPWESGAVVAFLSIEKSRGVVEVWALGEERFGSERPNAIYAGRQPDDTRGCQPKPRIQSARARNPSRSRPLNAEHPAPTRANRNVPVRS